MLKRLLKRITVTKIIFKLTPVTRKQAIKSSIASTKKSFSFRNKKINYFYQKKLLKNGDFVTENE